MLVAQLLQHVGVGAPAGLGLFPGGQHQLFEQHGPQLLGGQDVELLPRLFPDTLLQRVDGVGHTVSKLSQRGFVHFKPLVLHLRQHGAEGQLDLIKQLLHAEGQQLFLHGALQRGDRRGLAGEDGVLLGAFPLLIVRAPVQQRHLPVLVRPVEAGEGLEAAVLHRQPPQVVAPRRGVQQIAREGAVEDPPVLSRYAVFHGAALQVLDLVPRLGDAAGQQRPQRRAPVALVTLPVQNIRGGVVVRRVQMEHEQVVVRRAPDKQRLPRVRDPVCGGEGVRLVQQLHRGAGALEGLRRFAAVDRLLNMPFFDEFGKAELYKQIV